MTRIEPIVYPTARVSPFDPPPLLSATRDAARLTPLRYPDGHLGWLVTDYDLARAVLADARFSARSEFKRAPVHRPGADPFYGRQALPGWLVDMDRPEHTRIRRVLANRFTGRRIRHHFSGRIRAAVVHHLESMARAGSPADLVNAFALPIPSMIICELLGVPYARRADFQRNSAVLFTLEATPDEASKAMTALAALLQELVAERRRRPAGDVLSELTVDSDLNDAEIAGVGVLLLTAGHETTANSLSLGVFTLLCHPEQRARLPHDPDAMGPVADGLLRYLTVFHLGVPRTPLTDVELDGQLVRRGQSVTVCLSVANRDPGRFDEPDRLDIERSAAGHLAFGHGVHQCLGRHLARLEMEIALYELFRHIPELRLDCDPRDVPLCSDMGIYGVHALPVAW